MQKKHDLKYVIAVCSIASLAGLILGYDASVIFGAIEPLIEYFNLTPIESGWAVSSAIIGCIFGAYFVGHMADKLGRKKNITHRKHIINNFSCRFSIN